jgi:uncharacterized membrane protein
VHRDQSRRLKGALMRTYSFRPSLTLKGRKFKGLRGFAGKPFHPPLTDIPVGAYVLAAAFDIGSLLTSDELSHELYRAATFALIGGAIVSLLAALTGTFDWLRSTERGNQARRTVNAHATTMITVTVVVLISIALRLTAYDDEASTPVVAAMLSVGGALLTALGATIGGTLVFDYGFNVETAGDSPVWHASETDVLPGEK